MATIKVGVDTLTVEKCLEEINFAKLDQNNVQVALEHSEAIISWLLGAIKSQEEHMAIKREQHRLEREMCAMRLELLNKEKEHQVRLQEAIQEEKMLATFVDSTIAEAMPAEVVAPSEFQELCSLLDRWPIAVDPEWISNDRAERAEQVIDAVIEEPLEGRSFLDFGCGSGETLVTAQKLGCKKAIGFDIIEPFNNFEMVKENGPYDIVLLYDVIDHVVNENPVEMMKKVREVVHPESRIYVRCHPWTGRHGGHLYTQFNKAYAHLVFSQDELLQLGYRLEPMRQILLPLSTYPEFFTQSQFTVLNETPIQEDFDSELFENKLVKLRIMRNWEVTKLKAFPELQLRLSFVDYILKPM